MGTTGVLIEADQAATVSGRAAAAARSKGAMSNAWPHSRHAHSGHSWCPSMHGGCSNSLSPAHEGQCSLRRSGELHNAVIGTEPFFADVAPTLACRADNSAQRARRVLKVGR